MVAVRYFKACEVANIPNYLQRLIPDPLVYPEGTFAR